MSADQTSTNCHPEPPRQIDQPHHTPHNTAPPRPLPPQTSVHHGSAPATAHPTAPPQATLDLPSPTPSAPKVTLQAKVHLNLTVLTWQYMQLFRETRLYNNIVTSS